MEDVSVLYKLFCAMLTIIVINACGGDNEDRDGQTKSAPKRLVAPCGAMTATMAAQILAVAEDKIQYSYSEAFKTCSYRASPAKSISYAVYAEPDAAAAQSEMAKVLEGLKSLVDCESVDGIGEEAYYCNGDRAERLLVRQGGNWIDILSPSGRDLMTQVAEQILQE
jgi:hypothetical protein